MFNYLPLPGSSYLPVEFKRKIKQGGDTKRLSSSTSPSPQSQWTGEAIRLYEITVTLTKCEVGTLDWELGPRTNNFRLKTNTKVFLCDVVFVPKSLILLAPIYVQALRNPPKISDIMYSASPL